MNDHEMERLFTGYRDSLGACGHVPTPRKRSARARWALAAAFAATVTGMVALWPTDAAAKALKRIEGAILNARSMEMVYEQRRPDGTWKTFSHAYTRDGMWRGEIFQGTPLEATSVRRDGQVLTDYRHLDHATIMPGDPAEAVTSKSALDYAKESIDSGRIGTERTIQMEEHAPVGGVPAYALVLDRPLDDYHGTIVVDARNDLPIFSEYTVRYDGPNGGV